jgi:transmembrane sensor
VYHIRIVMDKSETYFIELVTRYFSGEATAEDLEILSGWVASDPGKRQEFDEYRRTWTLMEEANVAGHTDVDAEWDRFVAARQAADTPVTRTLTGFPLSRMLRIAAVALVLLIPAWFLWRYIAAPDQIRVTAETGALTCNLPDGSVVTLNKGAMIEYPETFTGSTRQVKITGEACFEVTHDASKPFIAQTGNVRVEVLGTVFYVNAGSGTSHVSVVLTSGSVATYFKGDRNGRVILEPGEAAEVSVPDHSIAKHAVDDPNLLAWKTHRMVFKNTSLQEIVRLLDEVYQVRITIADQRLAGCQVTATFDQQSLESVMNVLRATLNISFANTPGGIVITGNGCE